MILVNNKKMKKIMISNNLQGVFYTRKQLLKFEKPNETLSEEDMLNLFMGFVRLIKKSTELEAESRYLMEIKKLQNKLKKFEK